MEEEYLKHVSLDITDDIERFVKEDVFGESEYLFVKTVNNKMIGYCSKCYEEYEVEKLKHNAGVICPVCGAKLIVKNSKYGRGKCLNEACFYYFEKSIIDPNVITCKGYYISKDYRGNYKNPIQRYRLQAIYIFGNQRSVMLKNSWWRGFEKRATIFDFNQGWMSSKWCYCSFDSIEKAIKNSSYKYIPYKNFAGHYSMVKVFEEYTKHPWIEQLTKVGFENLIKSKLNKENMFNCLNYRGKDIYKILKISRRGFREIRKSNIEITPLFLRLYQLNEKDKSNLSPTEVDNIRSITRYNFDCIKNITKYTTLKKALKYIKKQFEKSKTKYDFGSSVVITWSDYIEDCKKLEMNLMEEDVLYPRDLYNAHQNTIKQVKIKVNRNINEKIVKRVDSINDKYYFEYKGLLIRAIKDSEELLNEGKKLHHCVGMYASKHANKETTILVIRKIAEENSPYFTVETRNNIIVQVRGIRNCDKNEEVREFIEIFKRIKLEKVLKTA